MWTLPINKSAELTQGALQLIRYSKVYIANKNLWKQNNQVSEWGTLQYSVQCVVPNLKQYSISFNNVYHRVHILL